MTKKTDKFFIGIFAILYNFQTILSSNVLVIIRLFIIRHLVIEKLMFQIQLLKFTRLELSLKDKNPKGLYLINFNV